MDGPGSVEGGWKYREAAEAFEEKGADVGYQQLQSDYSSEGELRVVDPTFNQRYAFKGIGNVNFRNYVVGLNQDKEGEIIYQLFMGKGKIRHMKMREATKEAITDFLAEMELEQVNFPEEKARVLADPNRPVFTELSYCREDNCQVCYKPEEKFCKVGEPGWKQWSSEEEEEDEDRKWKKDKRGGKKSTGRDSSPTPGTSRRETRPLPPIPGKPEKKPASRKESRRNRDEQEVNIKQEYEEEDEKKMSWLVDKLLKQKLAEQERKKRDKKRKSRQEEDKKKAWREALGKPGRKTKAPSSPSSSSSSSSESGGDRERRKAIRRKDRKKNPDEESEDEVKRIYTGSYKYEYGQTDDEFPDTTFWDNVLKEVFETNQGNIPRANKFNLGHIKTRYYRIINALKDLQNGSSSADVVRRLHKAAVVLVLNNVHHSLLPQLFVESCLSSDDRTLAESAYESWKGKPVESLIEFLEKRIMRAGGEELQKRVANEFIQAEFSKKNVNVHQMASKLKTQIAPRLCASTTGFSGLPQALKKDRIQTTAKQLFVEGLKTYRPVIYNRAVTWSLLEPTDVLQLAEKVQNLFLVTDPETVSTVRFDKIDKQLEDVSRKLEVNANKRSEGRGRGKTRGSNPRGTGRGARSRGRGTGSRGRRAYPRSEREPLAIGYQDQDTPEPCFHCRGNHRARDCNELREKQACFKCGSQDHFAKNCDKADMGAQSGNRSVGRGYRRTTFRENKACRFCKEQGVGAEECKNKAIHCFYCGGPFPCPTHSKPK